MLFSAYLTIFFSLGLPSASAPANNAPASQPAGLSVEMQAVDGPISGQLTAFSLQDGATVRVNGHSVTLPTSHLGWLNFPAVTNKPREGDIVYLRNGDRIVGRVMTGGEMGLMLTDTSLSELPFKLPLESVSGVLFAEGRKNTQTEELAALAEAGTEQGDQIILANGDTSTGTFLGLSGTPVQGVMRFQTGKNELKIKRPLVLAMALDEAAGPASAPASRPAGQVSYLLAYLNDGSTISLSNLSWRNGDFIGQTRMNGQTVRISPTDCLRLELPACLPAGKPEDRRFVWLSELSPAEQTHEPFVTLQRSAQRDRNTLGHPLSVGERTYPRGWGMASAGRLRFDLTVPFAAFVARVGMDDSGSLYSDADVRILADGKTVFEKHGVKKGMSPLPVRVDVQGVKTLELVVDFGLYGDLSDHLDWLDAALVKP